jgi:hypothetical protein
MPTGTLAQAIVNVCNRTQPGENVWAAWLEATLTWDGYKASGADGWYEVMPGRCETVFKAFHPSTVYVYAENKTRSKYWKSEPGSGTIASYLGEPRNAYWCLNDQRAEKWPDNKSHLIKAPPTCPPGSRLVSAGSIILYGSSDGGGDTVTLEIR